jgi:hypothetical protein
MSDSEPIEGEFKALSAVSEGGKRRLNARFYFQLLLSLLVVLFCMTNLMIEPQGETAKTYQSLMLLVVGIYIPTPRNK